MAVIDDLKTARDTAAAQVAILAGDLAKAASMSGAGYSKTKEDLGRATDAVRKLDDLIAEFGGESYFVTSRLVTE